EGRDQQMAVVVREAVQYHGGQWRAERDEVLAVAVLREPSAQEARLFGGRWVGSRDGGQAPPGPPVGPWLCSACPRPPFILERHPGTCGGRRVAIRCSCPPRGNPLVFRPAQGPTRYRLAGSRRRFPEPGGPPSMFSSPYLSVIVPAYNEARIIESTLVSMRAYLDRQGYDYEILVSADGNDGTREKVARLAEYDRRLSVLGSAARGGKGRAIRNAVRRARGEIVGFI